MHPAQAPQREALRQTAAEGEVLVRLRRGGVDRPGLGQLHAGDIIAVTPAEAAALADNGAGEAVIEQPTLQLVAAGDAVDGSAQKEAAE